MTASTETAPAPWQLAWRDGVAPCLSSAQLVLLHHALESDSPELCQGATARTKGPDDPAPCSACALGYCVWKAAALKTAGDVSVAFERLRQAVRQHLRRAESAADLSDFLCWFDQTPRAGMRAALLEEVEAEIRRRAFAPAGE